MKQAASVGFKAMRVIASVGLCASVGMASAQTAASAFAEIDRHALQATPDVEKSPDLLAAYLTQGLHNDREKARAIFRWITDRIEYDAASYFSGQIKPMDPREILQKRKAVCDGYSQLFSTLATLAHLQVRNITGYAKGAPSGRAENAQVPNHVWNAIRIDDQWYEIDSTWGAGFVDRVGFHHITDDFYFLVKPEQLLVTHYAVNDELGVELAAHLASADFKRLPKPPARLMQAGFDGKLVLEHARQSGFSRYVETYDTPFGSFAALDAPVEFTIAPKYQRMLIRSSQFEQIAAVQGNDFNYFSALPDGTFELSFQPQTGPLYVMGRYPGATEFKALLGYDVGE